MVKEDENKLVDTLKIGVYSIYDTVLKQFEAPFSCSEQTLDNYMRIMVNDPQSRFYDKESDFVLNKIASFDQFLGEIKVHFIQRIQFLDYYVNKSERNLQSIIRTLNYLPSGYFKMPDEQKKAIQDQIDDAITKYVSNYVIPDLDTSKLDVHSEELKKVISSSLN